MKKHITKKLSVALITGMLTLSGVALAADARVIEFISNAIDSSKAAIEALQQGDKAAAAQYIKDFKKQSNEIIGPAANKTLQTANFAAKQAGLDLQDGDMAKALENMTKTNQLITKVYEDAKR